MNARIHASLRAIAATAAGVVIAACIVQQEPRPAHTMPANTYQGDAAQAQAAGGAVAPGDYACSISSGGYQYPPFRCMVYTAENGGQVLEKVGGSQRFRGRILTEGNGFRFDGTFFCPYGDCTEDVSGNFAQEGDGMFRGTLQGAAGKNSPLLVSIQYMPGGFGYGGATYGGAAYGGARYAAPPPPPPR